MQELDSVTIARFHAKVDRRGPDECWPWTASVGKKHGYGLFAIKKKARLAHRVAFFIEHGRWPDPFCCHHCDNRPCCNPAHLFEGTNADNMADMAQKGRRKGKMQGTAHFRTHLTDEDVIAIRCLRGRLSQKETARIFGIGQPQVSFIQLGKGWRHVKGAIE